MIASMRRPFLFPGAQVAADFVYHPFDGVFVHLVDALGEKERKEEIARMLAGAQITDEARAAADSLLEGAGP